MVNENINATGKCCPHCEHELSSEEIKTIWSSYTTSLRQTLGGPKRMKRPCQSCGIVCNTAREAWSHCRIPRNMDPKALLAYVLGRAPETLAFMVGTHFGDLEALQQVVTGILDKKLKPTEKRQAEWYLGFIDKALDKLEDAA